MKKNSVTETIQHGFVGEYTFKKSSRNLRFNMVLWESIPFKNPLGTYDAIWFCGKVSLLKSSSGTFVVPTKVVVHYQAYAKLFLAAATLVKIEFNCLLD
jgi:hypothetical protein